jgi:hydrogenase-4 component B
LLPWLAGAMLLLTVTVTMLPRPRRVTRTWGCGLPELDGRMQYSSTAFSKPLRKAFPRVYKAERQVETVYEQAPYFASSVSYKAQRTTSFERSLYKPATTAVVNAARRLRLLQTGNIQFYLLYIFLALVALLLFARFA